MSKHMKRLNAPRALRIHRKEKKWTVRPSPGPHPVKKSLTLGLALRDVIKLADTIKEVKRILSEGNVLIDGKIVKEYKFPLGLMDVISIPNLKKDFRVLYDKRGKITVLPISASESKWKLCRIQNKTILKGKKTQLNLHDGRNIIVKKDEYKTGDVLKFEFKDSKISDKYELKEGSVSLIIGGSHIGEIANIDQINKIASSKQNISKMKGETDFTTLLEYVFPIGKNKPVISLPEVKAI